jgi:hypothetical protein
VHDERRGGEIAEALAVLPQQYRYDRRAEQGRQEIGGAQQIARERCRRRDWQPIVHDDFDSDDALTRGRSRAAELEGDGIEPFEQEEKDQPEAGAEAAHECRRDGRSV